MQSRVEETARVGNEAAQVRVTPEELAQATAAIEARQHALAQHQAATIPIGEALQQLNLQTTPEEVLAEVQTQRHAKQQSPLTSTKRPIRLKAVPILTAVIALQTALVILLLAKMHSQPAPAQAVWAASAISQAAESEAVGSVTVKAAESR